VQLIAARGAVINAYFSPFSCFYILPWIKLTAVFSFIGFRCGSGFVIRQYIQVEIVFKRMFAPGLGTCFPELLRGVYDRQSPFAKATDFVFPSLKFDGKVPLRASTFVADHLRVAAKAVGVEIGEGQRFGLHNLRHSLSNWLINKGKVDPETVQGVLRHANVKTTLDLYSQEDSDETRTAQGSFLSAMGMRSGAVN
jgi:integrase